MAARLGDNPGSIDEYHDPYCELCHATKRTNVKAFKYCPDCYQFLCVDCLAFHSYLQAAKGHKTVGGDDMPRSMAEKPPQYCSCDDHPKERKNHFCSDHKILICQLCSTINHKRCSFASVDQACQNISTTEINILYDAVSSFKASLQSVVTSLDSNKNKLEEQKKTMLKETESIYKRIVAKVDKMYQDMTSEITTKYQSQELKLSQCRKDFSDKILQLESSLSEISDLKGKSIDPKVFLKAQGITYDVNQCKSNIQKLIQPLGAVSLVFIPSREVQVLLSSLEKFGSVSTTIAKPHCKIAVSDVRFPASTTGTQAVLSNKQNGLTPCYQETRPTKESEIKVSKRGSYKTRTKDDKIKCWITGMATTGDGKRLLVDHNNSKVKMFSREMEFLSSVKMESRLWDVAVISDKEAVVSTENSLAILVISGRGINIKRTQQLSFLVDGITKYQDKLIITSPTTPCSVKMIDQTGKVYWSVSSDEQGQILFQNPYYVSCRDDGRQSTVIVTDSGNNTLTMLDSENGSVMTRRQVKEKRPRGIACDTEGNIYVCYYCTDEVAVLTGDLSEEKILLSGRQYGHTNEPQAIVCDETVRQLFLTNVGFYGGGFDTVDCFQLL